MPPTYISNPPRELYPLVREIGLKGLLPPSCVHLLPISVTVKRNTGLEYLVKASWHPELLNKLRNPDAPMKNDDQKDLRWLVIRNRDLKPEFWGFSDADWNRVGDSDHVIIYGLLSPNPGTMTYIGGEKFKLWVEISDYNCNGTRKILFQGHVGGNSVGYDHGVFEVDGQMATVSRINFLRFSEGRLRSIPGGEATCTYYTDG